MQYDDDLIFNRDTEYSRLERARLKYAISHHPLWPAYRRTALGGCNLNDLLKRDYPPTCDDLGIDIYRTAYGVPTPDPAMAKFDFPDDDPFEPVYKPMSFGGLAHHLGVQRQRIYNEVARGRIKAISMAGGQVIPADEVKRVVEAAVRIDTGKGRTRVAFNWI